MNKLFVECPRCKGSKAIFGRSDGPYKGAPATIPCPRCNSTGIVDVNSLTDLEKNPPNPVRYKRDDI
jgi:hypothetical protein